MLRTNLATRPFYNERAVQLALARGDRAAARSALAHAGDPKDALVRRVASAADRSLAVP